MEQMQPELSRKQRVEIENLVYEKYPITKGEEGCRNEKKIMDELREKYRKKIYEGVISKKQYE